MIYSIFHDAFLLISFIFSSTSFFAFSNLGSILSCFFFNLWRNLFPFSVSGFSLSIHSNTASAQVIVKSIEFCKHSETILSYHGSPLNLLIKTPKVCLTDPQIFCQELSGIRQFVFEYNPSNHHMKQ